MDKNRPTEDLVVVDANSPATKYETMLLEKGGHGPNEEKMILVFQILDQMIPQLGVFAKIMRMMRAELFDAVYSDQYTGSGSETSRDRYIQKIPYFTLVKRVYDERDERIETLESQLELLKNKLFDQHQAYETAQDKISDFEMEVVTLKSQVADLECTITENEAAISGLEAKLSGLRKSAANTEASLNGDIADLKESLEEAQQEVTFLNQYKKGYDELQSAFNSYPGDGDDSKKRNLKPVVATKRAHLISNIESAYKLEEQLLSVQNAVIEEFDEFMELHKQELCTPMKDDTDNEDMGITYAELEDMIDNADQKLMLVQQRFQASIEEMSTELGLLRQHRQGLQEQLQVLEENRPAVKKKKVPTATLR